jgi:FtsP/CotA-like multicopper oxidase with cupredoxin domain
VTENSMSTGLTRRQILAGGAGLVGGGLLGARLLSGPVAHAAPVRNAPAVIHPKKTMHLVGTDGWVSMPADAPPDLPFFPDPLAPGLFNTYVFGFRDVTSLTASQVAAQRGKAQISAPILSFDEEDDIYLTLTNLGLAQRPDLFDGHTLHWHGFVNAIPLFDGVPELSLAVPVGRDLTYFYRPHDPGTYMYHCHFEDVEHVQMGMTGSVFIRPKQNKTPVNGDPVGTKYAYNDGNGSTKYHREFAFMITELWSAAHYRDAHIQVNDWTDYDPSFWLLNGRAYPDTLAANGNPMLTSAGRLQYQPISSLIQCNAGEKVLLRMSNLGYQNHTLSVDNIDLSIVAKDASLLVGRDSTPNYITRTETSSSPRRRHQGPISSTTASTAT